MMMLNTQRYGKVIFLRRKTGNETIQSNSNTCPSQRRAEGTLTRMEKILEEVSRVDLSMCSAGLVYLASSAAAYLPDAFSLAVQYGLGIRSVSVSNAYGAT